MNPCHFGTKYFCILWSVAKAMVPMLPSVYCTALLFHFSKQSTLTFFLHLIHGFKYLPLHHGHSQKEVSTQRLNKLNVTWQQWMQPHDHKLRQDGLVVIWGGQQVEGYLALLRGPWTPPQCSCCNPPVHSHPGETRYISSQTKGKNHLWGKVNICNPIIYMYELRIFKRKKECVVKSRVCGKEQSDVGRAFSYPATQAKNLPLPTGEMLRLE